MASHRGADVIGSSALGQVHKSVTSHRLSDDVPGGMRWQLMDHESEGSNVEAFAGQARVGCVSSNERNPPVALERIDPRTTRPAQLRILRAELIPKKRTCLCMHRCRQFAISVLVAIPVRTRAELEQLAADR
eukprot:6177192-Pleurochrysis_carterae.AAC.1